MPILARSALRLSSLKLRDRFDQLEGGVDSALRGVFARMRVTEIGKHAIAQIPRDKAVPLVDHLARNTCVRGS